MAAKKVGSFGYDPWGFHLKGIERSFPIAKFFYEKYFRVESYGLENIPKDGRVLIIPNHSGQLPIDGALIGYAMLTNEHAPRAPKAMMERFFPTVPFVGNALNRMGAVLGDVDNCKVMLENEQAIIVFPEGVKGTSKVFNQRYQLQRFGNGFVHLAMKYNTPIIPVGVVGCEESIVSLTDFKSIAKSIGMPTLPLVIPIVWPTKVIIHFGQPIYFDDSNMKNDVVVKNVDIVKKEIKKLIDLGLSKRKNLFD
ncbi:MAG: lysophospholipid acyltransferase family protein [Chitinophagales bacterium]